MFFKVARSAGVIAFLAVGMTACAGTNSGSTTTSGSGAEGVPAFAKLPYVPPKTGCGSFTSPPLKDPDGALPLLPPDVRPNYAGYNTYPNAPEKFMKSAWSSFKPSHGPPYKVAIDWGPIVSGFQATMTKELKRLFEQNPLVGPGNVTVLTTGDSLDTGQQLQQYRALLDQKPDIVLIQTAGALAFLNPVKQAAKAGIPTIMVQSVLPSPYAIGVDSNGYLDAANATSYLLRANGGGGNALQVIGFAGSAPDQTAALGWTTVARNCDTTILKDSVYGGFNTSLAKSETLKYLATHPDKVDYVFETAAMTAGVIKAFQQTGRPVPKLLDSAPTAASAGYWRQQPDSYHGAGWNLSPLAFSRALVEIATRTLDGQGPKVNAIIGRSPIITDASIDEWAKPDWTIDTPGDAVGSSDQSFLPSDYLAQFFERPKDAPTK